MTTLSQRNHDDARQVIFVQRLASTIARDDEELISPLANAFLLVRQVPFPATLQLTLKANHFDPPLPLEQGDKFRLANLRLGLSNAALPPGSADIVLVWSTDIASFSAL